MIKQGLIACIRFYQRAISSHTPPSCRFTPTCSSYAMEAIQRYGVVRGLGLAVWRILRCNPFGKYGYDPVPDLPPLIFRRKNASVKHSMKPSDSKKESPQAISVSQHTPDGNHDEE